MPNWKKEKKSRSVNDIPVEKKHDHIIHSLDDGDFQELLSKVSQPSYCRSSSGYLGYKGDLNLEPNALVKVCEQGLRDEDEARQEKRRKKAALAFRNSRGRLHSCSRSISPEDSYKNRINRPVDFETMNIDYIDNDIEMTDLSGIVQPMRYTKGNREDTVQEFCQEDIELGNSAPSHYPFSSNPNERELQTQGQVFMENQSILPPQNEGMFSSLSYDMVGTDEIPNLTPSLMPLPHTAQKVHIPVNGNLRVTDDIKHQDSNCMNGKRDGIRKKKKKDKEAKNTFLSENVQGYMGGLPLDQLLNLIEGEPVPCESVKKQKGQHTSTENEDPVRKGRRRKSKESKDTKEDAVSPTNVATIGNHQGKAPLAPGNQQQDASSSVSTKSSAKESASATISTLNCSNPKVQNVNNKTSPKRRKSNGPTNNTTGDLVVGPRVGRFSTEDAEEEFLSADEGVALSPGEEQNATISANAIASSDVMLDGANYRADDEDVTIVDRQIVEEQEFITVSGKAKRKQTHQQTTRTGSAGKTERRSKTANERNELPRRNSLEERVSNKNRRPTTTSLADFMDEKKENKPPAVRQTTPLKRKVLRQERPESTADSEHSYHDAPTDEMAPTAVNGTPSPERAFSYADAAKKSSDQSRENSPTESTKPTSLSSQQATETSPSPSPVVEIVGTQGTSGAELPSAPVSSTGLSFFYDENEAANLENKMPAEDGAFVLNLGGKTVRFAKGLATTNIEPDRRHLCMIELMTQRWENFLKGAAPTQYTPKTSV